MMIVKMFQWMFRVGLKQLPFLCLQKNLNFYHVCCGDSSLIKGVIVNDNSSKQAGKPSSRRWDLHRPLDAKSEVAPELYDGGVQG